MAKGDKFKISDESINSFGFRVLTDGIDTSMYERNPVLLYDHDDDKRLPIGTTEDLQKMGGEMFATPVFDDDDEFAQSVEGKVKKRIIRMASASLIPIEFSDDPSVMMPGQKLPTLTRSLLREISITPFGSNKNAFRLCDAQGNLINLSEATKIFQKPNTNQKMSTEKNLQALLIASLNLSDNAGEPEIVKTVLNLHQQNQKLTDDLKKVTDELDALKLSGKNKELETIVLKAVEDKKITMAQKDEFMELNFDTAKKILEGLPSANSLKPDGGEGDEDKERAAWTFSDYSRKDHKALEAIKLSDKDRYVRLYRAEFGKDPE